MKNRRSLLLVSSILILVLIIIAVIVLAPENSGINLMDSVDSVSCLRDADDTCLIMPGTNGYNINSQEIIFPDDFETDYHLVVMPFDREQQVLAVTWLPLFQALVAEHDEIQLWSIAALPDLNPGVRLLVLGGISAAISDVSIRPQIGVLYLEDQATFLDALGVEGIEDIQVFILDADGVVYYRDSGAYTDEKGQEFRDVLEGLLN